MTETDFINEPTYYFQEVVEHISVARKEILDNAVFGEIKEMVKDNEYFTTIELNEKAIVEALKKQIPKEPTRDKEGCLVCGNCGSYDGIRTETNFINGFCWECGQAIKYTDHPTEKGGEG